LKSVKEGDKGRKQDRERKKEKERRAKLVNKHVKLTCSLNS